MSFFPREKTSLKDKSSQHAYDHVQRHHEMLNSFNGNFTFGANSGFTQSPYEIFRQNVASYCERFMYSSFGQDDFLSSEEKSLRALRRAGEPVFNERLAEGDASRHVDLMNHPDGRSRDDLERESYQDATQKCEGNKDCYCSSYIICENCRTRPSKSDTNMFSVMSVSFEPTEERKLRKPSLLKKITHLMNSGSHQDRVTISRKLPVKQRWETTKWDACECHVHIGRHRNCCQCQEPYHRTNCECAQHNGSHSYCCRCHPHLLQEYDEHLKKKRYLRLMTEDEELSPVNSVDHQAARIPRSPRGSVRADATAIDDFRSGQKSHPRNQLFPPELNQPYARDIPNNEKEDNAGDSDDNHHPCESCCNKLDEIYGTALREVHNMLMDVSRTLLPSAHCCSLETRIQNVSRLRSSFHKDLSVNLEIADSEEAEPEWTKDVSGTSEVGVQVTPNDLIGEEHTEKKKSKKMSLKNKKCIIS